MQFQKYKNSVFAFSIMAKNQFLHKKKNLKLPKMQFSDFFVVQKLIFCHFWKCKERVFVLLKLHFFSNFRALCCTMKKIMIFKKWIFFFSLLWESLNPSISPKDCFYFGPEHGHWYYSKFYDKILNILFKIIYY